MCGGDFEHSKMFIEGAVVFYQIRRSWKSWGHRFFFCEKYRGLNLKNKQENKKLLSGYNILLKFVFNDNPHANYQRYAQWGLHYWFMMS